MVQVLCCGVAMVMRPLCRLPVSPSGHAVSTGRE
jgi:hypothetical protein